MRKTLLSIILLLAITKICSATSLQSLNKAQAIHTIQNKTITTIPLITLDGRMLEHSISAYFNKDGKVQGRINKSDNNNTDEGKWSIQSDGTLCTIWDSWNQHNPICVSIYKVTNGLLFINKENNKLETIALNENIKKSNQL